MTEIEKYLEKLVVESLVREFKKLDLKKLNREAKKEFKKRCRYNRLLGFTHDKYEITFSTKNSGIEYCENKGEKNDFT